MLTQTSETVTNEHIYLIGPNSYRVDDTNPKKPLSVISAYWFTHENGKLNLHAGHFWELKQEGVETLEDFLPLIITRPYAQYVWDGEKMKSMLREEKQRLARFYMKPIFEAYPEKPAELLGWYKLS